MKTLQEIVDKVQGVELRAEDERAKKEAVSTTITAISYDSRTKEARFLFVALRGERFDGHDFIDSALENGAAAVLVDTEYDGEVDVPVIVAEDTRRVLGPLGSYFFDYPSQHLTMVGITGTNGKTTSSYLLESILSQAGKKVGIIGTIEYRWPGQRVMASNTTPDGLVLQHTLRQMVDDNVEIAVIEVSSHGLQNGRVDGAFFDVGLFTNLSWDHVDFHGSMEAYRRAKWKLFLTYLRTDRGSTEKESWSVINSDQEEGQNLAEALIEKGEVSVATHTTIGQPVEGTDDHFEASDLEITLDGISMSVEDRRGDKFEVTAPIPGRFNAENILGTVAVARILAIDPQDIADGLAGCVGIPGRMERVGGDEIGPAVFVDFAHSPDALKKALITLRPLTNGELWVVFGCGGDRDHAKRGPMGRVAVRLADRIIVTSDNPRSESPEAIIDEIVAGIEEIKTVDESSMAFWEREVDRSTAIFEAISTAGARDLVLVAGKGHETYQEQNGRRKNFDDRVESLRALRQRGEE